MIYINTNSCYYDSILFLNKNGWRHRLDGPAVIVNEKHQVWYVYGKLHREDGPAVINGNQQEWYVYGKLHREDGPAVINGNQQEWYIEGKKYNETEYHEKLKEMGLG